jgi:L,D-transpeptidase ErfK/SrfK
LGARRNEVATVKQDQNNQKSDRTTGWLLLAALLALVFAIGAQAQSAPGALSAPGPARWILVSIPDRELAVLEGDTVIQTFPVSVGAAESPSPTGDFRIINRVTNPTYYHPHVVIPAGRDNPIGPRWIGLNRKSYGIHGTNEPGSVGRAASHGCIRLRNRDIKLLFAMVRTGDEVEIRAERDQQTAQVFGNAPAAKRAELARTQPPAVSAGGEQQETNSR